MNHAFSVADPEMIEDVSQKGLAAKPFVLKYAKILDQIWEVIPPKGIIFHDYLSATEVFANTPLPAYTSRRLIHVCPVENVWEDIFLNAAAECRQLNVELFYKTLSSVDMAVIASHQYTHYLACFLDSLEETDSADWFIEGLSCYLPRRLLYDEERFESVMAVEEDLIRTYRPLFGNYGLKAFGQAEEPGNGSAGTLYDYWRSTRTVRYLVEECAAGNIKPLLQHYVDWKNEGKRYPFSRYLAHRYKIENGHAADLGLA